MWSSYLKIDKKNYKLEGYFNVYGQNKDPFDEIVAKCASSMPIYGELGIIGYFDVSLKNVSHLVETIKLDEVTHRLYVRCRILDTPSGKIIKSIIDENLGRALGFYLRTGNDSSGIKKIFTIDIDTNDDFLSADRLRKERKEKLEKIYGKNSC